MPNSGEGQEVWGTLFPTRLGKANPQTVLSSAQEKKPNRELRSREESEAFSEVSQREGVTPLRGSEGLVGVVVLCMRTARVRLVHITQITEHHLLLSRSNDFPCALNRIRVHAH